MQFYIEIYGFISLNPIITYFFLSDLTCYMQACLLYVNFESLSNANLREVFGLTEKESYKTSRIIKDALDEGLIKPVDPDTAPRYMRYIPFWA